MDEQRPLQLHTADLIRGDIEQQVIVASPIAANIDAHLVAEHRHHHMPRLRRFPQHQLGALRYVAETIYPCRPHPPFLVLVKAQNWPHWLQSAQLQPYGHRPPSQQCGTLENRIGFRKLRTYLRHRCATQCAPRYFVFAHRVRRQFDFAALAERPAFRMRHHRSHRYHGRLPPAVLH